MHDPILPQRPDKLNPDHPYKKVPPPLLRVRTSPYPYPMSEREVNDGLTVASERLLKQLEVLEDLSTDEQIAVSQSLELIQLKIQVPLKGIARIMVGITIHPYGYRLQATSILHRSYWRRSLRKKLEIGMIFSHKYWQAIPIRLQKLWKSW
jgi:hypothetical protein